MPVLNAHWIPLAIIIALISGGCVSSGGSAPIEDRYSPSERAPKEYIVSRGDTLFSIAWRYGFDVKRLAAANKIPPPFTIYPGQAIHLKESNTVQVKRPTSVATAAKSPEVKAPSRDVANPVKKPTPKVSSNKNESWRWPVNGRVVRAFVATGQAHKGIDIGGKIGEPVHASRSGVVVYSGSGLVGYGNLLILKHSEQELSAYGHNKRVLVKEGQKVKAGSVIAELGDSGTDSAKLHFEVRINGKPVDPLRLLPKQN